MTSTIFSSFSPERPQILLKISLRENATPGLLISMFSSWNSTCVRSICTPFLNAVRLFVLIKNGPYSMFCGVMEMPAVRDMATLRYMASTRATSSDGLNGFTT